MAVHCGGPGSLSSCVYNPHPHHFGYNVIAFDQRGMGRSSPTFLVEECTSSLYEQEAGSTGILGVDLDDEESIRSFARLTKARNLGCWNYPSFKVPVDEDDDTSKTFHFLEYSGTRQLSEDIERIRILFGDHKLSVHGISYMALQSLELIPPSSLIMSI